MFDYFASRTYTQISLELTDELSTVSIIKLLGALWEDVSYNKYTHQLRVLRLIVPIHTGTWN